MECSDFSEFQMPKGVKFKPTRSCLGSGPNFEKYGEVLRNMRKTEDIIINTLNSVIPTDSFNPDGTKACKELHGQLVDGNLKRKNAITQCISLSTQNIRNLKEKQQTDNLDPQLSKTLRAEQTKLRMLQVEFSVEELVSQRSSKVFNERCRKYYKPE